MNVERKLILLADDNEINRMILGNMLDNMLDGEFDIVEAKDGNEAVKLLQERKDELALILLDAVMPELDGFGVLGIMNAQHLVEDIPVIMISAETTPDYMHKAFDLGAVDYIHRPFDQYILQKRIKNTLELYGERRHLIDLVIDQVQSKDRDNRMMIAILSHIVEFRNGESGQHVQNVNIITEMLLNRLVGKSDKYSYIAKDISVICLASSLHDIGKLAIPEEILNKPGKLTAQEFEIMKTHTLEGAKTIESLELYKGEKLVKYAGEICRSHHERWDGRGYPDGLAGDNIPIAAQVVSLADVYDALTAVRCYKDAYSHAQALQMILKGECGQFNPLLLECLQDIAGALRDFMNNPARVVDTINENITTELLGRIQNDIKGNL